ncbi:AAA family ATPase [Idiomarina ramblicola]|uniref:Rad50/SbcC-type AAA domain-containing protein n=1 Tax=Idiomarina ramblicola TaxID=263724 RepID=A0A432Z196_9GAMM|nr:AAA family ATPase [Idiomarina ramblicola]RUO71641.1 hypothetical protein CWI78_03760 [Idiomarina ramblicola]
MQNLYISKVQVEGGFLDGLNIELENGLNTVIGARGTGKSSLIELIRFCLSIPGHTAESSSKSLAHAKAVLRDGQVSVTLSDGNESYHFSRTVDTNTTPQIPSGLELPLIFSQTEVENIGLLSSGRLKLIDDFNPDIQQLEINETSAASIIESLSIEIAKFNESVAESEDQLAKLPELKGRLKEYEEEEKKLKATSDLVSDKSDKLSSLSEDYLKLKARINAVDSFIDNQKEREEKLKSYLEISKSEEQASESNFDDESLESLVLNADAQVRSALEKIIEVIKSAKSKKEHLELKQSDITKAGQKLRTEVDSLQKGAGEISRKIQRVKEDIALLESIEISNENKERKIMSLTMERDKAIDSLRRVRIERAAKRQEVCEQLTNRLKPRIRVHLEENSQLEDYQQVIIEILKGTGIKYNELAPAIANSIPPEVLFELAESNDFESFSKLLNISQERAGRVLYEVAKSLGQLATVRLEDEVILELLDGSEPKDFSQLSTGQRCTVILPIILQHTHSTLIVDQPEDHIDNAFIVETLISALKSREGLGQTIVTTHNANIPVLGEASQVMELHSDGTRGHISTCGALSSSTVVEAISTVMEGGREAFRLRAKFYD